MRKVPVPPMKAGTACLTWLADHVTRRPPLSTLPDIACASRCLHFDNARDVGGPGLTCRNVEDSRPDAIEWFRQKGYA